MDGGNLKGSGGSLEGGCWTVEVRRIDRGCIEGGWCSFEAGGWTVEGES